MSKNGYGAGENIDFPSALYYNRNCYFRKILPDKESRQAEQNK